MSSYQFRGKRFFLTYPRCDVEPEILKDFLYRKFETDKLKNIEKYVVCREEHKDGGFHLHAFVALADEFRSKEDSNWLDINGHHPNIENVRSPKNVIAYVCKGGKFIANFDVKVPNKPKKELGKLLLAGQSVVDIVQNNPELVFGYKRLREDVNLYRQDIERPGPLDKPCGVWIAGPSGVGKSTITTTFFGNYYFKDKSKWWDGYSGEETVIIEDIDASWRDLIPFLKIWADKYPFRGETKGSMVHIRPKRLVVTSNRTIDELLEELKWPNGDYEPYKRRFKEFYIRSIEDYKEQCE